MSETKIYCIILTGDQTLKGKKNSSDLEDIPIGIVQNTKKGWKNEQNISELWDNIKFSHIHVNRAVKVKRDRINRKNIWRNNSLNFSKFDEKYNPQIQKAQQPTGTRNEKKNTPWHITIKLFEASDKEKSFDRSQRSKDIIYRGTQIKDKNYSRLRISFNAGEKTLEQRL